jgi:CheY-like chemotaxis protein
MATILLVEDNEDNRELIHALLDERYTLRSCGDGYEALACLEQETPDLLLCDIALPGMDGTTLLERIRARSEWAGIPAVALTSHAMKGDREQFLDMGFDQYISKPIVDDEALIAVIEELLQPDASDTV